MSKYVVQTAIYIWQLPQHLLGLILLLFSAAQFGRTYSTSKVYFTRFRFGISLGRYIIVFHGMGENTIKHEFGHSKQSQYLGPLYLILVGIPSFFMSMLTLLHILKPELYYKRWPENWADSLGGVKRT